MPPSESEFLDAPRPSPVERRGYRIGEFCQAFSLSKETAYNLMRVGKLRYVVIGGRRLILRESAEQLLHTGDGSKVRDGWERAVRAGFSSDAAYQEHLRQKQKRLGKRGHDCCRE